MTNTVQRLFAAYCKRQGIKHPGQHSDDIYEVYEAGFKAGRRSAGALADLDVGFCGDPYVHNCGRLDCPTSDSYRSPKP